MTKTLKKNISRSIKGSLGRYIAIMLIIMLGVAFLTGLRLTRPSMMAIATDYIDESALFDLRLISTLGFDAEDVAAAESCDGVVAAQGSINADFIWLKDGEELVYRAHMLTDGVNEPQLTAGRMPKAANECLADSDRFSEDMIGQTIEVSDCNDEDTLNAFAYDTYTIVGLSRSPLYMDIERGTTSLGNGSLTGFLIIPEEGFDFEVYTELYIKADSDFALYSDEYDTMLDALTDDAEEVILASLNNRFDSYLEDAAQEIAEAEQTLAEEEAKARAELDDAWQHLEDAYRELKNGEAELRDAETQLADAKQQLDAGAEQMQSGFTSWEGALESGWAAYEEGLAQLEASLAEGEQQLADSKAQLDELEQTWADGQAELDQGWAEYNGYLAEWQAGYDEYAAGLAAYENGMAQYNQGMADYTQSKAELEAGKDSMSSLEYIYKAALLESERIKLETTKLMLDANKPTLEAAKAELDDAYQTLLENRAPLDEAQAQLDELRAGLDQGWSDYNAGAAELAATRLEQQAKLDQAKADLEQFQAGIDAYYAGADKLESGKRAISEGWLEYNDGVEEYNKGLEEFDSEIEDAKEEIKDAKEDLADLSDDGPELYVLGRNTNTGYVTFESDSQIVDKLAGLFPIFFFLIAALVCSTTMTRMVDDDRTQIGTLRALGYSRGGILAKYLFYAGSASTIGCLIGYFGGGYLFPLVIWTAYQMLYNIPGYICVLDPVLFIIALEASLLCSAGTTYFACRREMSSTPADLIRPKTPSAGKRILLERITPLWKRLKFLHKVTLRNIFRFKKRMIMMILGISGCTALVLTGFGVHDSVTNIANFQFDDIQKYDISVNCEKAITDSWLDDLMDAYGDQVDAHAIALMCSGDLTGSEATKTVHFLVSDDPNITQIIDLHLDGEHIPFPGQGEVVISEKLARLAGVKVGDTVSLSISDTEKGHVKVVGLVENYVMNYVYLTGETYDQIFDDPYEPTSLMLRLTEDVEEYSLSASLSNERRVASVSVISDTRKMIDNMMVSLNYVVALILICAGALAFIVLFNLGNINITERVREIATIKVLGFHSGETGAYVFRENIILSMMGILLGLPLGAALHTFVMAQIQVDMVSFKVVIKPLSYLLTVLLVTLFTVATDLIMRRKIARIDMAESLKSIE